MRLARETYKKKAKQQQSLEDESLQLDQLVAETKEKVEAIRVVKARAAESRRQLEELQAELEAEEDPVASDQGDEDTPMSKSDIGALVANSIQSAVSIIYCLGSFYFA